MAFSSHGVRVGVRVDSEDLQEGLDSCLPRWRSPIGGAVRHLYSLSGARPRLNRRRGVRRYYSLYAGGTRIARSLDLGEVLDVLSAELELVVALTAARRLFVHAGSFAWRGKVYLLPGASGRGKSTLVAELERQGALVLSEEFAVLDQRGRVFPHPRAPRLGSLCRPESPTPRRSLPFGGLIATRFRPDGPSRFRRLGEARALMALFRHTVGVSRKPERVMSILTTVTAGAPAWQGPRGEAPEAARAILGLLDRAQAPRRESLRSA